MNVAGPVGEPRSDPSGWVRTVGATDRTPLAAIVPLLVPLQVTTQVVLPAVGQEARVPADRRKCLGLDRIAHDVGDLAGTAERVLRVSPVQSAAGLLRDPGTEVAEIAE